MIEYPVESAAEWQPGDPLYSEDAHPHSNYLFNFRPMGGESENCTPCIDAACWPKPRYGHTLPDDDRVAAMFERARQYQEAS